MNYSIISCRYYVLGIIQEYRFLGWGARAIPLVKLVKHHQWVVLNRAHSEIFVRDWIPVNAQSEWRIWLRSGAWSSEHRVLTPRSFYYPPHANTCTDEYAFMATIFGALEPMTGSRYLPGFGGGHIDMDTHASQGRCRTWSYWNYDWDRADAALASEIAKDVFGSKMSCYPNCHARPATLEKLSSGSFVVMGLAFQISPNHAHPTPTRKSNTVRLGNY